MNTGTVLPYWVHDEQLLDAFIKGCKKNKSIAKIAEAMEMNSYSLTGSIKYIRDDYSDQNYTPEQYQVAEKLDTAQGHSVYSYGQ